MTTGSPDPAVPADVLPLADDDQADPAASAADGGAAVLEDAPPATGMPPGAGPADLLDLATTALHAVRAMRAAADRVAAGGVFDPVALRRPADCLADVLGRAEPVVWSIVAQRDGCRCTPA